MKPEEAPEPSGYSTPLGHISNDGPMKHEGHKHNGAGHGTASTPSNRPYGGPTGISDADKGY